MNRYFFYYEDDDSFYFEIEADNYGDAFDRAYEAWGPQVLDMYYKIIE